MDSVRWKILLQFQCRNRLLLTGTPIQNTMAEVGSSKGLSFISALNRVIPTQNRISYSCPRRVLMLCTNYNPHIKGKIWTSFVLSGDICCFFLCGVFCLFVFISPVFLFSGLRQIHFFICLYSCNSDHSRNAIHLMQRLFMLEWKGNIL